MRCKMITIACTNILNVKIAPTSINFTLPVEFAILLLHTHHCANITHYDLFKSKIMTCTMLVVYLFAKIHSFDIFSTMFLIARDWENIIFNLLLENYPP